MLVLQHVRVLPNVLTPREVITLLDVFEVEEDLVLLAQVVCPVMYRGAVGSRRLHHIYHDSGDINFVSPRE